MKPNSIVTRSVPPNLINTPEIHLYEDEFDKLVQQRGYEVIYENAIPCPCKVNSNNAPLSNCQSCGGSGWVLFNPNQTRMILQSLNYNSKYKSWSVENVGTVTVTSRSIDRLEYMGRITVVDSDFVYSQILRPVSYNNTLFAFTIYDIVSIEEIFMFQGSDQPLLKLDPSKYSFDGNKLILDNSYAEIENLTISVRYHHRLQYHVIDLTHQTRRNYKADEETKGYETNQVLPFSGVARLSHYVLDAKNFEGNNIQTNDYSR